MDFYEADIGTMNLYGYYDSAMTSMGIFNYYGRNSGFADEQRRVPQEIRDHEVM
jgi:hypothetical protein